MKIDRAYVRDLVKGRPLREWTRATIPRLLRRDGPERTPKEHPEIEAPRPEMIRRYDTFAKVAGAFVLLAGYHVFVGWTFDIAVLKAPAGRMPATTAPEAICLLLSGVALYFLRRDAAALNGRIRPLVVPACAGLIGLIAVLSLIERIGGVQIDRWLLPRTAEATASMAPSSAGAFLLIAGALFMFFHARWYRAAQMLAAVAAAISLLVIADYLYGVRPFPGQMPLYAAVSVFLVSGGLLCVRADKGFMAKVSSDSFGGVMARQLLPAALLIPILLGWMQREGPSADFYRSGPGFALLALANVVCFVIVVWWGINSFYRMDTKRRQTERTLSETAVKLKRSNADLEQFAYVASHDLKEPLRAISGSIQVLQQRFGDQLGSQANEVITHTVDGANRMQTLIDDLLTYSRLTTREAPLAPVDCGQVLQDALTNLDVAVKESKAVVTFDPLPVVNADRTQLVQLFQNLLGNAIKYRSDRTPKIHVAVEDAGREWHFSVRDNGIGIAPQYISRIFKIFQRLHTRKEYAGTGIGLAICKQIVERHGGRIWVESSPRRARPSSSPGQNDEEPQRPACRGQPLGRLPDAGSSQGGHGGRQCFHRFGRR